MRASVAGVWGSLAPITHPIGAPAAEARASLLVPLSSQAEQAFGVVGQMIGRSWSPVFAGRHRPYARVRPRGAGWLGRPLLIGTRPYAAGPFARAGTLHRPRSFFSRSPGRARSGTHQLACAAAHPCPVSGRT